MPWKNGKWRPTTRYSPEFALVMRRKAKREANLKKIREERRQNKSLLADKNPRKPDQATDPKQGGLAWINPVPAPTEDRLLGRRQKSIRVMSRHLFAKNVG